MESEGVDVLKDTLNTSINVAFLWFCLRSEHMWNLFLLCVPLIILEEEVPAEWWLHVVHKGSLFVNFLFFLLLLLCAVLLALASSMKVLLDDLLDFTYLFPLEPLEENVVLDVL
jgi:hypothetical protein